MEYVTFLSVVLFSNIVQGITGFAGTILAMPPSIMLVGYGTAKPILNVLGIFSGVYVVMTHGKHINWKELKKILVVMAIGIIAGIAIKKWFVGGEAILYKGLGIFVIILSLQGIYKLSKKENKIKVHSKVREIGILLTSGTVHGMFVCGGPLLIGYLSEKIKEKVSFRATISFTWIVLNTIIMLDDVRVGLWNSNTMILCLITIPFLIAGMYVGAKLYTKMSQEVFMKITYILLFISGISLIIK